MHDIGMLSMAENSEWQPLLQEDYRETQPQISPNGEWIAYTSNEEGQSEIYVCSFPEVDKSKSKISTDGGTSPLWSPDGRWIYYRASDNVMAVAVETEPSFEAEKPQGLFKDTYYRRDDASAFWAIHPDGKRFLMMKEADADFAEESSRPRINIVVNWFEELKKRIPVD